MVSPSYEDRICTMFDSFSKTASRNYYRDLLWTEKRWDSYYHEELADYILELLGYEDKLQAGMRRSYIKTSQKN